METQTMRIRSQLQRYVTVQGVMGMVNTTSLMEEHNKQDPKKAIGIDGVDKLSYGANLGKNIENLLKRKINFNYKPLSVQRSYIPKLNGKMRPLAIPAYEDRLVQGAIANILNTIYEELFLNCSFEFRPNRGCHDAIRAIDDIVMHKEVN